MSNKGWMTEGRELLSLQLLSDHALLQAEAIRREERSEMERMKEAFGGILIF